MNIKAIVGGLLLLAAGMYSQPVFAQSGVGDKLAESFDAMVNVSEPRVYQGNRRSIVTGGSISIKMRTNNVQAFTFRPPSLSVGCGGIDGFFGAFSMISKEVLVQALRGIVTAAIQYAFKLALGAICPQCKDIMTGIGDILAEANQWLGDSCNITSNFLEGWGSSRAAAKQRAETANDKGGAADDHADGMNFGERMSSWATAARDYRTGTGESVVEKETPEYGNHIYRMFHKSGEKVFNFLGGGNDEFFEEMMSVTGTVVLCSKDNGGCPDGNPGEMASSLNGVQDGEFVLQKYLPTLTFEHLVTGKSSMVLNAAGDSVQPSVWRCDTHTETGCLRPKQGTMTGFVSMKQRLLNAFVGTGGSQGIIRKLRYDYTAALTPEEEEWMKVGGPTIGMVITLARSDTAAAEGFVFDYADAIAAEVMFTMLSEYLDKARSSASAMNNSGMNEAIEMIEKSRKDAYDSYARIQQESEQRGSRYSGYMARLGALR